MERSNRKKLGDLAEIKHGFAFPGKHIVSQETDRILVTPGHFALGGGFRHNHKKYFDSSDYRDGYELESGDLVVTMTDLSKTGDTLGYSAVVPDIKDKILLHNQRIGKVVLKSAELDKNFCHYLLRSKSYRQHVLETCTGSTVKHTSPTKILDYEFDLPSTSDQKAIAHILGTLDDKIDLNQKMNQTLEEIAKAIFKSWFVDFDPVRAKMEGRPTGLPPEIDELFPDELVDSEIGEIPKGWNVLKVKDEAIRLKVGKLYSNKTVEQEGSVPVLDQSDDGIIGYHSNDEFVSASLENPVFTFANHTCKMRLLFSDFGVIQNVIPLNSRSYPTIWFYLRTLGIKQFEEYKGHIPDFMDTKLCFPTVLLAESLSQLVTPLFHRIEISNRENKVLSDLRDTLLPKLISGELRIPDAEKFLEEAGL